VELYLKVRLVGDVTLFHQRPNKAFACELTQLFQSRFHCAIARIR
jgi:hypothetical protein